ncbi:MAG: PilC/PilY family type IV pilus protein [Lautropia sp.]|nr:PilC/PilY family type IV pilus protein [Lautropia sp.]
MTAIDAVEARRLSVPEKRAGKVRTGALGQAVCLFALALCSSGAHARLAQESLIVKEQPVVEPNLMFTLDDSGSMSYNFVPDNELGGHVFAYHPMEPSVYVYHVQGVLPTDDVTVIGARRRSAAINRIYYDPEVRYLPWIDPASVGVNSKGEPVFKSLPDADPSAAYVHWNYQAGGQEEGTKDIRVNLIGNQPRAKLRICAGKRPDREYREPCPELPGATHVAPATYYDYIGPKDPDETQKNTMAHYRRVSIKDHTSFERGPGRTECAPQGNQRRLCTQAQEYQNFANWYQYHRTRMHVAIASVGRAFANLPPGIRVGYGRINQTDEAAIDGVETSVIERGVRLFNGHERKAFFEWLNNQISSGSTPLLEATRVVGNYFLRRDDSGPWSARPGSNERAPHISCRRSYHLLMTDGLYNDTEKTLKDWHDLEVDNVSGPVITRPDGSVWQYQPGPPYRSEASRTLADFSMYFWNRDLRPDLRNDVPADAENPAFWQHLSMYTLSFGVGGKLVPPASSTSDGNPGEQSDDQGDWPALKAGTTSWPSPIEEGEIETIDDLWHAAVNSRGEYLSVQNGSGFFNSVNRVLSKIVARQGSTSGVSVSSQALQAGNQKFVPSFKTGLWVGDLTAYALGADGTQGEAQWRASENIPKPDQRYLFVGNGYRSGPGTTPLRWGNALSSELRRELLGAAGLSDAAMGERLIAYFRGEKVDEENGRFRRRNGLLGHIVHSPPVYVGAAIDRGYQYLPREFAPGRASGATQYRAYLTAKAASRTRPGQVFVGSNDGILHAFDAATGVETYGYVPRAVAVEMARLSRTDARHRLMMDGPLLEADAWWDGKWRNVLLGTTGAGPRAIFALDVTDTRPGTGLNARSVLWEVDAAAQPEIGHVLATPEIGVTRDGSWVAVLGNGYESQSGRAQLFVLNLKTGQVLARLDTGRGNAQRPNGLGGVRLIRDGNQVITGAYAGDLQGNVWKFDLASDKSSEWKVSFGGKPLFVVQDGRPLTAAPATVSHPLGGMMVLVGTGKLFDEGDNDTRDQESVYGLWDNEQLGRDDRGRTVWKEGGTTIDARAVRQRQVTMDAEGRYATLAPDDARNRILDWRTERGWRVALDMIREQGQRNIVAPQLVSGLVLFETMSPVIDESDVNLACRVTMNTPAFNLLLDPLSGRMMTKAVIDTNGDGAVNGKDKAVGGWALDDWTGRSVVLTEPPPALSQARSAAPCTEGNCSQLVRPGLCPPGMLMNSAQNVTQGTTICVEVPAPSRWWWRELSLPDVDNSTGRLNDPPAAAP